jgi:hypothetical protein
MNDWNDGMVGFPETPLFPLFHYSIPFPSVVLRPLPLADTPFPPEELEVKQFHNWG